MSGKANVVRLEGNGGAPPRDRRAERRRRTAEEIVQAAWGLVAEGGLASLSMRELGDRVGMRAQSVYSYFASKDEIYDAMYRQGYEAFVEWMRPAVAAGLAGGDPVGTLGEGSRRFFEFCVADPVRYQLLFQRTIPGFEPSEQSYAVAVAALEQIAEVLAVSGVTDPEALDLWTATFTGLTSQQLSNDPGGSRWERLVDRAVAMLVNEVAPHLTTGRNQP